MLARAAPAAAGAAGGGAATARVRHGADQMPPVSCEQCVSELFLGPASESLATSEACHPAPPPPTVGQSTSTRVSRPRASRLSPPAPSGELSNLGSRASCLESAYGLTGPSLWPPASSLGISPRPPLPAPVPQLARSHLTATSKRLPSTPSHP